MSDRITCPNCRSDIEITEVMAAQLGATIRAEIEAEFASKANQLTAERQKLAQLQKELDTQREQFGEKLQEALTEERDKLAAKLRIEAQQAVAVDLQDREAELREAKQQLKTAQNQELEWRRQKRELEQRAEQQELEIARRLDQERNTIRTSARKQAQEENSLKLAERDQKIDALAKQLQEAQRRLEQGSQQTQGEVQEIALERLLAGAFPHDVIEPVPKGVHGGDVLHHVFDDSGRECGIILWESKRTKKWNDQWLGKAIDDQQQAKASCACIVSSVVPESVEHLDQINGVWIASWQCARTAATVLRHALIESAHARRATEGQLGKKEHVYNYLFGPEFRNRVRGLIEPFAEMQLDLEREKKAFMRVWNKRQKQLDRALTSTHGLYGDLQGILGNGLQEIEGMDALAIESDGQSSDRWSE